MKKLALIFTIFFVFSCKVEHKNDLIKNKLKSNVSSVIERIYSATEKFGEAENGNLNITNTYKYNRKGQVTEESSELIDPKNIYKFISLYDENGKIKEFNIYIKDGNSLYSKTLFINNEKGINIEKNSYNSNGNLNERHKLLHDQNGNITEANIYNADGNLTEKYTYKYDDSENMTDVLRYKSDGSLFRKSIYLYDSNGNSIEYSQYESDGSLVNKDEYKYDEKENIIENTSYKSNGAIESKTTYKYNEFDKSGNWRKKIEFSEGQLINIIERDIAYY